MTIAESILATVQALPPERQQEVLDFAQFLHARVRPRAARTNLEGLWAGMGVSISEEDIAEARREMWGRFAEDSKV